VPVTADAPPAEPKKASGKKKSVKKRKRGEMEEEDESIDKAIG
jgi:U3 small nucleolar ribonucleoprotein component